MPINVTSSLRRNRVTKMLLPFERRTNNKKKKKYVEILADRFFCFFFRVTERWEWPIFVGASLLAS